MKQKTKQLQSSGETRKTSRTWHFLSTLNSLLLSKLLLLLIIPAIGSTAAWATDYTQLFTVTNPGTKGSTYSDTQNNVTVSNSNNIQEADFNGSSGVKIIKVDDSHPISITSTTANIRKIVFTACYNSSGTTAQQSCNVATSADGSTYSTLSSGVSVSGADGTSSTSTDNIFISGYGGSTTVTVEFATAVRYIRIQKDGKETRVNSIQVYSASGASPTLSSIAVKTAPTKITYTANETFDPAGLVIRKTMSDSSTSDVIYSSDNKDDFNFSPSTSTALDASNTSVTITYGGKTTTQAIEVNRITNTLALSTTSGSMTVGDDDKDISGYINITSKNNTGTAVTYSSDAEGVATVSSSGAIHAVSAGTAHITVAQAQTNVYTAGSATYTVTVNAATTLYTVTFNGDGFGTPVSSSLTETSEGGGVSLPSCTPSHSDYIFQGWATTSHASSADAGAASAIYNPSDNVTLYAVYTFKVYVPEPTNGSVVAKYTNSGGNNFVSGTAVTYDTTLYFSATPSTGYQFTGWGSATGSTDNPLTMDIQDHKTFTATFTAKTYDIKLDKNNGSASTDGSAIATFDSNKLTGISAPTYSGMVVEGYYKESACTNQIADASGNLVASTDYTTDGLWKNDGAVILYAKWVDAPAASTALPVTYDFRNKTKWPENGTFISAGSTTLTNRDETGTHSITFRASGGDKFYMTPETKLSMKDNGSKNNYIAIPISGIKGRIDIDVWTPYGESDEYKLKFALDTENGTTIVTQPTGMDTKKSPNKYVDAEDGYFNFRIKDITATSGVLYLGRGESNWTDFYQIRITTEDSYIVPEKTSVTLGDAQVDTIAVKNNTSYNVRIKTYSDPTIATSWYLPAENRLAITAVAPGTTSTIIYVDKNGNGEEDGDESTTEQTITITVNGITKITTPNSAVYDTSGGSASPEVADISITATHRSGADMTYQWYKNTVNSNTGGTAISGATNATLSNDKISTLATEDASFYYCVVSSAGCKSKASDVAYVLTSKTKRYFQMSNVAGNKETSATEETITGQIIAGGKAFVENTAGDTYRYITRPNSSTAHTYVAGNSTPSSHYFKVVVDKTISTGDVIFIQLNGLGSSTSRGVYLRSAADVTTNQVELKPAASDGIITKTYTVTGSDCLHDQNTFYIVGVSGVDYFTDLVIGKAADLTVGAPTPASQTVQVGDTPATISVTASGGDGDYTYQWYRNTAASTSSPTPTLITGATSASYTPPTAGSAGTTTYYYCLVEDQVTPSGYASVTVNTPSHGWHTPTFTNSVEVYALTETNFKAQPTSSSSKFWTKDGSVNYTKVTIAPVSETEARYMNLESSKTLTFYVKNAIAFDMIAGDGNNTSRNAKIKVGDTQVGSLVNNQKWTDKFSLNADGDKITIYNADNTITLGAIRFYMYSPIEVHRGETVLDNDTIYLNDGAVAYDVTSSRPGTLSVIKPVEGATGSDNNYTSSIAHVQFVPETGTLTVTPSALGTETITIAQAASGDYPAITRTFTVVVAKHTLKLDFTLDNIDVSAAILTNNTSIPAGSLPTLHYYLDGVETTLSDLTSKSITVNFMTDDPTIAYFDNDGDGNYDGESEKVGTAYTLTYGGGQGGAQIYAYAATGTYYSAAKDFFGLNIKKGTFNKIGENEEVDVQEQFVLQDNNNADVVTLTYGGYRYLTDSQKQDYDNQWHKATTKSTQTDVGSKTKEIVYDIDGYKNYTRHNSDALNEYDFQLKGMSDDYTKPNCPNGMWYKTSELKPDGTTPYGAYERIRPFALPCKGGYLKFDIHQTGTLTVYVWQNGSMNEAEKEDSKKLGSKPRLGYWFDQDGWVKHPKVAPITKQPITKKSYGRDVFCDALTTEGKLATRWTEAKGDAEIIPMLLRKYCNNAANPTEYYAESGPDLNPYYWKTQSEIETNLNEEATIIPEKIRPVPFHNGYMVPQNSYLKYVIDVVAGKTYYFYGMMTKVGYVGMNFIPDNTVADVENVETLHLNNNDDMASIVSGRGHNYTVYNEVTLPSNYRAGKWNTICLPFALSENQVEEAFGKGTELTLYNGLIKKGTDYTIKYMSHVDRNILPGQPYFIKPSGVGVDVDENGIIGSAVDTDNDGDTDGTRITFNVVCIDKNQFNIATCKYNNEKDVDGSGAAIEGNGSYEFVGAYDNPVIESYSYLIHPSTGNIRQYTGTTTSANRLNTYRAYLKPKSDDIKHMSLDTDFTEVREYTWLDNDDDPTGVKSLEEEVVDALNSGKMVMPNKAYNLMGQEIDPRSAKGLVIINGKKVMY